MRDNTEIPPKVAAGNVVSHFPRVDDSEIIDPADCIPSGFPFTTPGGCCPTAGGSTFETGLTVVHDISAHLTALAVELR